MDVFLVPLGADKYVLYCEAPAAPPVEPLGGHATFWSRVTGYFKRVIAEGEEEQNRKASEPVPERGRVRRWIARKLADAVVESRLLWRLRNETRAGLVHPDDMTGERAVELARAQLAEDSASHLRWCIIDALVAIACIPISLIPGPNFLGYYFLFRAVGHLYSLRGARHGLREVTWATRPTTHLTSIRTALNGGRTVRRQQIEAIGHALGLDRLAAFVDRAAPAQG